MDDLFCDQTRAYGSDSAAEPNVSAVIIYEQLKEAIEQIGKTLADNEELLTIWHGPAGDAVLVEHIGYYGQALMVFGGRDVHGAEYTVLVSAYTAQLILKKMKKNPGEVRSPVTFMGHAVTPGPPVEPSA